MALDFERKAKIVIFCDSVLFVYICVVVFIWHRIYWREIQDWIGGIGIHTSANNLILILIICYGILATAWIGLMVLLYRGVKQRSSIKLLVWSLLHFISLVPYTITAVFAIGCSLKFLPLLIYIAYRAFILWVVNGINPEIIRHRRPSPQIYRI